MHYEKSITDVKFRALLPTQQNVRAKTKVV